MKKNLVAAMLFATIAVAFAIPINKFQTWHDLINQSPDIIIARCTAAQDLMTPKPTIIFGNVFNSDIEIISVLKGDAKLGASHLASLYLPYRGEYFVLFANHFTEGLDSGYSATEDYRVISLGRHFKPDELLVKTLSEQVQTILSIRVKDLNDELERDKEEKVRLETGLDKKNADTIVLSNTPSTTPETRLPKGGATF